VPCLTIEQPCITPDAGASGPNGGTIVHPASGVIANLVYCATARAPGMLPSIGRDPRWSARSAARAASGPGESVPGTAGVARPDAGVNAAAAGLSPGGTLAADGGGGGVASPVIGFAGCELDRCWQPGTGVSDAAYHALKPAVFAGYPAILSLLRNAS